LDDLLGRYNSLLSWNNNLLFLGNDGSRDGFDGIWDQANAEISNVGFWNLNGFFSHGKFRGICGRGLRGLGGLGLGDNGVNEWGRGLVDCLDWKVGGGDTESQGVGNVVDALNDTIGIDVAVGSSDDSIGSLVLSLDAVLVGIAVLVLAKLILGVELVGGGGHGLRDGDGLADQVGLGNDGLVDNVLLGVDGSGVDLRLANDVLGLSNHLLGIDLRLGNNLLGIDLRLGNNLLGVDLGLSLNNNLRSNDLLNGDLWLSNILDWLDGLNGGNGLLLRWLVGDGLGDQLQVLLPSSGNLRGVLNLDGDSSGDPESSLVGDVVDRLDDSVGVDVVVVAADNAVGALLLFTSSAGLRVAKLVGSELILAVVLSQDGDRDDLLSGNRFSSDSFLNSGFLGLLNGRNSCVDDLGVDLGSSNWNRCADDRGVSMLGVGGGLGDVVRVGGGIGKMSILDIGNNDALLRLDSSNNWDLGLDLDRGGFGLNLNDGWFFLGFNCNSFSCGSFSDSNSWDGLSNRGNWQVGGSYPESEGIGDVVGGLDDAIGIDIRVRSLDDAVSSPDLILGRVLVAVAVVVLADLILSMELVCRYDRVGVVAVDWCVSVVGVRGWLGRHQAD
jgi:hypothetical protein